MKVSKVLIIYTGGTIGMIKNSKTDALETFDFENLLKFIPELKRFDIQIDTCAFEPIDSADMSPEIWIKLVEKIEENYFDYDGFVVLHGTDTMSYSASALSFMLENIQKPIIFTGSQLPIDTLRTDGKENLITSIEIAGAKENGKSIVSEVAICFENQLFRGNRTRKYNANYFDAFESPNYPKLAEIGIDIKYNYQYINKYSQTKPVRFHKKFDRNVAILKLFPGICPKVVESVVNTDSLRGLVIETFGAGNAPTQKWFTDILIQVKKKNIFVVNVSQCNAGSVKLGLYDTSRAFLEQGVISGKDITTEAAITKMMFLLGQNLSNKEIKYYLTNNLAGEMSN